VSLSPIEIAKAFDAPLLRGPGSNVPQDKLAQIVGEQKVKLGGVNEVVNGVPGQQLRFVDGTDVSAAPSPGATYE
jgi:hypothetical protein